MIKDKSCHKRNAVIADKVAYPPTSHTFRGDPVLRNSACGSTACNPKRQSARAADAVGATIGKTARWTAPLFKITFFRHRATVSVRSLLHWYFDPAASAFAALLLLRRIVVALAGDLEVDRHECGRPDDTAAESTARDARQLGRLIALLALRRRGVVAFAVLLLIPALSGVCLAQTTPTISAIAFTSDPGEGGYYGQGDHIEVTVNFTQAVTVVGTPEFTIRFGGFRKTAVYNRGSGSTELVFRYTVNAGDFTPGANTTISIDADAVDSDASGKIKAGTVFANLTHDAVSSTHKVDTKAPEIDLFEVNVPASGSKLPPTATPLYMSYLEGPLDPNSVPNTSAFTVKVDGIQRAVTAVDFVEVFSSLAVELNLDPVVRTGETVTISYEPPSTNAIRDLAGNEAGALTDVSVDNFLPITAPEKITTLKATAGSGSVTLEWEPPFNGGSALRRTTYNLQPGHPDGFFTAIPDSRPGEDNERSYTFENLSPGTTYTFRLRVANGQGLSPASDPVTAIPFGPPGVPSAPLNLTAEARDQSVILRWTIGPDGGHPITKHRYSVYVPGVPITVHDIPDSAPGGANDDSFIVTGLTNGTTYSFGISAENDVGPGPFSSGVGATPLPITVPGKPRWVGSGSGDGEAVLHWSPPADTGGLPITGYEYQLGAHQYPWFEIPDSAPGEANHGRYKLKSLPNGEPTVFRMRAVNMLGPGQVSNTYTVVPQKGAPPPPSNFRATSLSDRKIKLAWTEPVAGPGVHILGYDIEFSKDGVSWGRGGGMQLDPGTTSLETQMGRDDTRYYHIRTLFRRGTDESDPFAQEASPYSPVVRARTREDRIGGLPQLYVSDTEVFEADGAVAEFAVTIFPKEHNKVVTVRYATVSDTATAFVDYRPREGTLVFDRGETEKIVSVPIINDNVDDSGETFSLVLHPTDDMDIADDEGIATIRNREEAPLASSPLIGFTLVNAATGTDVGAITDGGSFTIANPVNGNYGVRVETTNGATIDSVKLELSGTKTETQTQNWAPYSLYGDDGKNVAGAGLPAGSYTLKATAYAGANLAGAELQVLEVSFTVAAEVDEPGEEEDSDPLTAVFMDVPNTHGGPDSGNFIFRVLFSEDVATSYLVLRDGGAFAVSGGIVRKARRVNGRDDYREIHVEPTTWNAVTVTLAGGRACGTAGAVCTADNRVLSNTETRTIPGPLALSVADAEAEEGEDAALAFVVSLNRASSETVTVEYASSDGTATAGSDYDSESGTLTFSPGVTEQTVNVPVINDAHNDDGETMKLTLSNPSGARIRDAEATGTIRNSDPIPKAWLARFGRAVAENVMEAVGARIEGNSPASSRLTFGGHEALLDAEWPAAGALPASWTKKGDSGRRLSGGRLGRWGEKDDSPAREVTMGELLLGSSFHLASASSEGKGASGRWSLWGRGARSSFSGNEDELTLEGDVTTGMVGADYESGRMLLGVALAWSTGDGSYSMGDAKGELESTLASAHPYLRYAVSERLTLWGVVGLGEGELTHEAERTAERVETDLSMGMAAVGARGALISRAGFELAVKSDVLIVRTESDETTGLAGAKAGTRRLRLSLEGSREVKFEGGVLRPSLEVGLRHDGGDAETGSGVELGGGLRWAGSGGLAIEMRARGLIAHEESDYEEWGVSASVNYSPGAGGRGLSIRAGSTWGAASGGAERLWSERSAAGLARSGEFEPDTASLEAEVAYGLGALGGLLTPYSGLSISDGGHTFRAGGRFELGERLTMRIEGDLREKENGEEPVHGVKLEGTMRW